MPFDDSNHEVTTTMPCQLFQDGSILHHLKSQVCAGLIVMAKWGCSCNQEWQAVADASLSLQA